MHYLSATCFDTEKRFEEDARRRSLDGQCGLTSQCQLVSHIHAKSNIYVFDRPLVRAVCYYHNKPTDHRQAMTFFRLVYTGIPW